MNIRIFLTLILISVIFSCRRDADNVTPQNNHTMVKIYASANEGYFNLQYNTGAVTEKDATSVTATTSGTNDVIIVNRVSGEPVLGPYPFSSIQNQAGDLVLADQAAAVTYLNTFLGFGTIGGGGGAGLTIPATGEIATNDTLDGKTVYLLRGSISGAGTISNVDKVLSFSSTTIGVATGADNYVKTYLNSNILDLQHQNLNNFEYTLRYTKVVE